MKTGEIRDLNFGEMHQKVSDLKEELFKWHRRSGF